MKYKSHLHDGVTLTECKELIDIEYQSILTELTEMQPEMQNIQRNREQDAKRVAKKLTVLKNRMQVLRSYLLDFQKLRSKAQQKHKYV